MTYSTSSTATPYIPTSWYTVVLQLLGRCNEYVGEQERQQELQELVATFDYGDLQVGHGCLNKIVLKQALLFTPYIHIVDTCDIKAQLTH